MSIQILLKILLVLINILNEKNMDFHGGKTNIKLVFLPLIKTVEVSNPLKSSNIKKQKAMKKVFHPVCVFFRMHSHVKQDLHPETLHSPSKCLCHTLQNDTVKAIVQETQ